METTGNCTAMCMAPLMVMIYHYNHNTLGFWCLSKYQMNWLAADDESSCPLLNDKHTWLIEYSNIDIGCLGSGCWEEC